MNKSGLRPQGHSVLVRPYEVKTSMIEIPDSVRGHASMLETRAHVIEVGPSAWADEKVPRAKPGDRIMIAKYAGVFVKGILDDVDYRIVNDRDIFCTLEEKVNE